jgi:oligoendopeptidase F
VPLYRQAISAEADDEQPCSEKEMTDYVGQCAEAMGGYAGEAWEELEKRQLWELEPGEYKLNASFEVYLSTYRVPLIFVNPTQTQYDKLVLAHEFGHFVHDYVTGGNGAGTDVAEVLSQGMEYLSLCLCEDTGELTRLKMTDSLSIYVEQAAYASFEQQLYEMEDEDLTAENVLALYTQVGTEFGFDAME